MPFAASVWRLAPLCSLLLPSGLLAVPVSKRQVVRSPSNATWVSPIAGCKGFDCVLQYIGLPDSAYTWYDTKLRLHGHAGGNRFGLSNVSWTGYVLNMTSQRWLTGARVDHPVWWHNLVVIVPETVEFADWATLVLDFGINTRAGALLHIDNRAPTDPGLRELQDWFVVDRDNLPSHLAELKRAVFEAAVLAARTRAPAAALLNLPNSGEVFSSDPLHLDRLQDFLKGFTYQDFLDHPEEPERIHEMPVAKATVRAMDAIQAFTASLPTGAVRRFGVTGYSKLGTATYVAAAADHRVKAIAPMAIFISQMPVPKVPLASGAELQAARLRRRAFYGLRPGDMMDAYAGMMASRNTPEFRKLLRIVDPMHFMERLTMPKLIILGASDRIIGPSVEQGTQRYVPVLPGQTAFLEVPNCDHNEVILKSLGSSAAFFRGHLLGRTPPSVNSTWRGALRTITATQTGDAQLRPLSVQRWDGPMDTNIGLWTAVPLATSGRRTATATWSSKLPWHPYQPQSSAFIDLEFEWPEHGHRFHVSTMEYPQPGQ